MAFASSPKPSAAGLGCTQNPSKPSISTSIRSEHGASRKKSITLKMPRFLILGPLTPQVLELSSPESSSTSHSSSLAGFSAENEQIGQVATPPSSPILGWGHGNTPMHYHSLPTEKDTHQGVVSDGSPAIDWVEYERPVSVLDDLSEGGSSDSGPVPSVAEVFNREDDHQQIVETRIKAALQLLSQSLTPPPSPKTPTHRVSKPPGLATIRSASTSASTPSLSWSSSASTGPNRTQSPAKAHVQSDLPAKFPSSLRAQAKEWPPTSSPPAYKIPQLREPNIEEIACKACAKIHPTGKSMQVFPCGDILCPSCFSSSLSAVSVTLGASRCPCCLDVFSSFDKIKHSSPVPTAGTIETSERRETDQSPERRAAEETVVMRIDNVAWDVTPDIVEAFLPPGSLPVDHPQPVHILLDRWDGRTKDYLYVEVASLDAARNVLQTRQSHFMPGGQLTHGRKRPITITQVHHAELIAELRPKSAAELFTLLLLCQASIGSPPLLNPNLGHTTSYVAPSGLAHFVKSRHGPFYALMSILSKLKVKGSPVWWDLFHVSLGAIGTLVNHISRGPLTGPPSGAYQDMLQQDMAVLSRLFKLFHSTFTDDVAKLGPCGSPILLGTETSSSAAANENTTKKGDIRPTGAEEIGDLKAPCPPSRPISTSQERSSEKEDEDDIDDLEIDRRTV